MIVDVVIDAPLRRTMERRINAALTGYHVQVGAVDLHLFELSIDLKKITVLQNEHPDPPVAWIPSLHASVQWKALLSTHLVGDVVFEQPSIHIDLPQLAEESRDDVPLHQRGWQDALQAIYPLKINALEVYDATVVYQDEADYRPLRLSHVRFHADNIRTWSGRGTTLRCTCRKCLRPWPSRRRRRRDHGPSIRRRRGFASRTWIWSTSIR
jgi:hypothetical protein